MPPAPKTDELAPYAMLYGEKPVAGRYFICEGRYLVEEAIRAAALGQLRLISLLCATKQAEEWRAKIPPGAQLLSLGKDELNSLVGFDFHRGVLCCCAVPEGPPESLILDSNSLLVLPRLDNADNLGQLVRTAAALGVGAVLLGRGPDPFSRRCVRVSMGAVWKIPILKSDGIGLVLDAWSKHCPEVDSEIVGTAQMLDAEPFWAWGPTKRTALVLGLESYGLDFSDGQGIPCHRQVRIPLERGIDSLNVAAAGAILMARMLK